MKKSQMEILGLAFVVILISIGMLVVVKIMASKAGEKAETPRLVGGETAKNMLNAMINTETDCNRLEVGELIADCVQWNPVGSVDCGGVMSCEFVEGVIEEMLAGTFDVWKQPYAFYVYSGLDKDGPGAIKIQTPEDLTGLPTGCDIEPGLQPLPNNVMVELDLYIC